MNPFFLFDPTTLAIMAPAIVLFALIIAAATRKRCVPWPIQDNLCPAGPYSSFRLGSNNKQLLMKTVPTFEQAGENPFIIRSLQRSMPLQAAIYITCLLLANAIFSWAVSHLLWAPFVNPGWDPFFAVFIPLFLNFMFSILVTVPVLCCFQLYFFRRIEGWQLQDALGDGRFISCIGILTALLMLGVPLVGYLLAAAYINEANFAMIRELFRFGIAFSTIPLSVAGMAIAFYDKIAFKDFMSDAKLLQSTSFCSTDLSSRTDDELHRLIAVALRIRKVEAADEISNYLLTRAASSDTAVIYND